MSAKSRWVASVLIGVALLALTVLYISGSGSGFEGIRSTVSSGDGGTLQTSRSADTPPSDASHSPEPREPFVTDLDLPAREASSGRVEEVPVVPEGYVARQRAIDDRLIDEVLIRRAETVLSRAGQPGLPEHLPPDAWRWVADIMKQYLEEDKPRARLRYERIWEITKRRVAAGQAEVYPALPKSHPDHEKAERAFLDALKPRDPEEIVQGYLRSIVRIRAEEDPRLAEVMRQYREAWNETAVKIEIGVRPHRR